MHGSTMLMVSLFFYFLVFQAVAWGINRIAKRQLANGALWFVIIASVYFVFMIFTAIQRNVSGEVIGELLPSFLIPIAVAGYYARKFRARKNEAATQ